MPCVAKELSRLRPFPFAGTDIGRCRAPFLPLTQPRANFILSQFLRPHSRHGLDVTPEYFIVDKIVLRKDNNPYRFFPSFDHFGT